MAKKVTTWEAQGLKQFPDRDEAERHDSHLVLEEITRRELSGVEISPDMVVDFMIEHACELLGEPIVFTPSLWFDEHCGYTPNPEPMEIDPGV